MDIVVSSNRFSSGKVEITVIVPTFNSSRKTYLMEALHSLILQTLDKRLFEVLIYSNYTFEIPSSLNTLNYTFYTTSELSLGSKIAKGIENSTGNIICVLEDDDLWEMDRLLIIYKDFVKKDEILFYRNNYLNVDATGSQIYPFFHQIRLRFSRKIAKNLFDSSKIKRQHILWLMKAGTNYNLSCQAIKRNLVEPYLTDINGMTMHIDSYFFFLGLLNKGFIEVDPRVLTINRIHNDNSFKVGWKRTELESEPHLKINRDTFLKISKKNMNKYVQTVVCSFIEGRELIESLEDPTISRKSIFIKMMNYLKTSFSFINPLYDEAFLKSILYIINRRVAEKLISSQHNR